ncbi:hypothetical protein [Mucisphaera sp.]|uniref:hypothetical protein n=1 Tax=Mucisphaera sp. TaxID=2913024 RepID=UPI003D134891
MRKPSAITGLILSLAVSMTAASSQADIITVSADATGNYTVNGSGFGAGGLATFNIESTDFETGPFGRNALLLFDTASMLPADATINSIDFAYTILRVTPGSAAIELESLLGPFSLGGATVAAQSHTPQGTLPSVQGSGTVSLDVALAASNLLDPSGKFALRLTAAEPSITSVEFAGSGNSVGSQRNPVRPRLIIDYTPIPEPSSGVLALTTLVLLARRTEARQVTSV